MFFLLDYPYSTRKNLKYVIADGCKLALAGQFIMNIFNMKHVVINTFLLKWEMVFHYSILILNLLTSAQFPMFSSVTLHVVHFGIKKTIFESISNHIFKYQPYQ